jgi:hypothetical protein
MSELLTLLGDDVIGVVRRDRNARLTFVYDETWRRERDAVPLSLSMPLAIQPGGCTAPNGPPLRREAMGRPFRPHSDHHILKPGIPGLGAHAENEHFCLALAGELGLPVVSSTIQHFDGEVAIVVERYDRIREGRRVVRVHQEDFCQALAVHPEHKYEGDGGPGARSVSALLRTNSRAPGEDVETFVRALASNWLIAGTDAHAKNYSVLLGAASKVRRAAAPTWTSRWSAFPK